MLRYFHSPSRGALARAPTTSLWQSVLPTRRVLRPGTKTASPNAKPRNARRELSPFWQLGLNSPLCVPAVIRLQNSMFVDSQRRPLAVARSFKYQSPPRANPELQDGVALRKPNAISDGCGRVRFQRR